MKEKRKRLVTPQAACAKGTREYKYKTNLKDPPSVIEMTAHSLVS